MTSSIFKANFTYEIKKKNEPKEPKEPKNDGIKSSRGKVF